MKRLLSKRTMISLAGAGLLTWGPCAAQAQAPASMDGDWRGRILLKSGRQLDGRLQLDAAGGSWRVLVQNPGDPCVGILTPVAWRQLDDGRYQLDFQVSKALNGCRDYTIVFERVDTRTLKGRSETGVELVLTRGEG